MGRSGEAGNLGCISGEREETILKVRSRGRKGQVVLQSLPGRGKSKDRGPEAGACLLCSRKSKEARG